MASIYKRGKVWWIKFHISGVRIQQSLKTSNVRIARARKTQVEYRLSTGGLVLPSEIPIEDFLEDFCQYLKATTSRKSSKNDISYLRTFFGPICPSLKPGNTCNKNKVLRKKNPKMRDPLRKHHVHVGLLEDVSSETISQFISRRVQVDGIAPKTANRLRGVLHRMFAYAIKEKGYRGPDGSGINPAANVDRRIEAAPCIRFLTLPQIEKQLHILRDQPTLMTMVATLIYCGLRREELLWLTIGDVDLKKRLLYVRAKTVNGQFWQPKTKRNRTVPVSRRLHGILKQYSLERAEPWFFPSPQGRRWDPDNFSEKLRAVNRTHDLAWSSLDFRHTFGSHLAQKGESLYKISKLMGNSPQICRKHYASLMPEKMHDTVEFETSGSTGDANSEAMLREILDKLDRQEQKNMQPSLRVVNAATDRESA